MTSAAMIAADDRDPDAVGERPEDAVRPPVHRVAQRRRPARLPLLRLPPLLVAHGPQARADR